MKVIKTKSIIEEYMALEFTTKSFIWLKLQYLAIKEKSEKIINHLKDVDNMYFA